MNQYILISRIRVQNANAVAGFTWGFPAITHFLGFVHNLGRKLQHTPFSSVKLSGVAVISHEHHVHVYGPCGDNFTQSRNPPYLHSHDDKAAAPPIIEEGKMNMVVSLLIGCDGNIGNQVGEFVAWLEKQGYLQRLGGGSVIDIGQVKIVRTEDVAQRRALKSRLLPGFVLVDRSESFRAYHERLKQTNPTAEPLDAWLDFAAYKEQARPTHHLIDKHLHQQGEQNEADQLIWQDWNTHLDQMPYHPTTIPASVKAYFSNLVGDSKTKKLESQWQQYLDPTDKTAADWERLPRPEAVGYLVPIVCGYKAISPVYENPQVENTRDSVTPVCFVEAVHSVGEWRGVHRLRSAEDFAQVLWNYHHESHWYLCSQGNNPEITPALVDDEF